MSPQTTPTTEISIVPANSRLSLQVGAKVESLYRDIRALRIYEGATEVQQLIIGKSVLRNGGLS